MLIGVTFGPGAQIVAAAELLALPWAEWFQRMGRDHERDVMQQLRHAPGKACVPGVGVDEFTVDVVGHLQIHTEGSDGRVVAIQLRRHIIAYHTQRAASVVLRRLGFAPCVECAHRHVDAFGQHLRQLLHMYAGAAIDMRRVFAGENVNFHNRLFHEFHAYDCIHHNTAFGGEKHNGLCILERSVPPASRTAHRSRWSTRRFLRN